MNFTNLTRTPNLSDERQQQQGWETSLTLGEVVISGVAPSIVFLFLFICVRLAQVILLNRQPHPTQSTANSMQVQERANVVV